MEGNRDTNRGINWRTCATSLFLNVSEDPDSEPNQPQEDPRSDESSKKFLSVFWHCPTKSHASSVEEEVKIGRPEFYNNHGRGIEKEEAEAAQCIRGPEVDSTVVYKEFNVRDGVQ